LDEQRQPVADVGGLLHPSWSSHLARPRQAAPSGHTRSQSRARLTCRARTNAGLGPRVARHLLVAKSRRAAGSCDTPARDDMQRSHPLNGASAAGRKRARTANAVLALVVLPGWPTAAHRLELAGRLAFGGAGPGPNLAARVPRGGFPSCVSRSPAGATSERASGGSPRPRAPSPLWRRGGRTRTRTPARVR
jgi:hypothetical protein